MLDRLVITMNTGGCWISPNVEESHKNAAASWGAEYLQLLSGFSDPFGAKLRAFSKLRHFPGRVCWLDGDVIIRYDCDDLFEIVPHESYGGILNYQGDTHQGDPAKYHLESWNTCREIFGAAVEYSPDFYINGGVQLFTPAIHSGIFDRILSMLPAGTTGPMIEQSSMNVMLAAMAVHLCILPRQFNRIGPTAWEPGQMTSQVQHLARYRWTRDDKSPDGKKGAYLDAIDWRVID